MKESNVEALSKEVEDMTVVNEVNELIEANDGHEREALVVAVTQLRELKLKIKNLEEKAEEIYNSGYLDGASAAADHIGGLL